MRGDKWHFDEIVVKINGRVRWLWRSVDQHEAVLNVLVQSRRDASAAKRLMHKLLKKHSYAPRVVVTDKLRSYGAAIRSMGLGAEHRQHKGLNNRVENSHKLMRAREKAMRRFKSPRQLQRFAAAHDSVVNLFMHCRYHTNANFKRTYRSQAFVAWETASDTKSFFSSLKKEKIRKQIYKTRDAARADVFDYIEVFYNQRRRHSHLGDVSPAAFEQARSAG